ncbi:MAG: TauD/TfdA family dioxygenase [Proteobacteria bacterium]|nr:TauD/TfdA family dioxygenase [Pseudomonadota bacterium]
MYGQDWDGQGRVARRPAVPLEPAVDPAAWYDGDITRTGAGTYQWETEEIADIEAALERFEASGKDLVELGRDDFPLHAAKPKMERIKNELVDGLGFALVHGLPVANYTKRQSAIIFLGLGAHIGRAVSQNYNGHILGHVKDLGFSRALDSTVRAYHTSDELDFHSDSCDVVGLYCLHEAKRGGTSRITSAVTIYNEMLKRRPELAAAMAEIFYHDRRGEVPEGMDRTWQLPIFCFKDGYLSIKSGRHYIIAAQRFPEVPRMSDHQREGLDYYEELGLELEHHQEFRPGDIQFLNNHVIVHSRSEFEDWPEEERKRHLYRLWLEVENIRPLDPGFMTRINGIVVPGMTLKAPLEAE